MKVFVSVHIPRGTDMDGNIPQANRGGAPKRTLITLKSVVKRTSISKTRIYEAIRRGTFPRPVPVGERRRAWIESEIEDWIDARVADRDATAGAGARPIHRPPRAHREELR